MQIIAANEETKLYTSEVLVRALSYYEILRSLYKNLTSDFKIIVQKRKKGLPIVLGIYTCPNYFIVHLSLLNF